MYHHCQLKALLIIKDGCSHGDITHWFAWYSSQILNLSVCTDAIFSFLKFAWQEYAHLLYTVYADSEVEKESCSFLDCFPALCQSVLSGYCFSAAQTEKIVVHRFGPGTQTARNKNYNILITASFGWMQFSFWMSEIHSFTHWFCSEVHKHCSYWLSMLLVVSCINTTDSRHTSMNSSHSQPVMPHLIVVFMKR